MQIATITATGQQVEIVAVNGGWTTVQTLDADTREMKVRNGALSGHTTMSGTTAQLAMNKAERARTAKPTTAKEVIARARKPIEERLNGVVYAGYLPQYQAYATTLRDGTVRRSIDKGDEVAQLLRGLTLEQVYAAVAKEAGQSTRTLVARFEHLNPGMQRMNLGNMLRRVRREAAKVAA